MSDMIFKIKRYYFRNIINQLATVTEKQYALCVVRTNHEFSASYV
jgi:hypothetical protein